MSLDEINALTVNDTYIELLDRILDLSVVPEGEQWVTLHENEELSFYERILLHPTLVKPTEQVLNDELTAYKAELTDAENARLAELARIKDIEDRFKALKDVRGAIYKAGLNIANPAIELKRIIKENDQERLELLELKDAEYQAEDVPKAQRKEIARRIRELINGCVDIVIEHNLANQLPSAKKDKQKTDHADLFQALNDYRPGKFKSLLTNTTPDGDTVTQELKDELLEYLTSNGL